MSNKIGRPSKDGSQLNIKLDKKLFTQLEFISDLLGVTRTSVVESALSRYFEPYRNKNGDISFLPAYLISGNSEYERKVAENEGREVEITKTDCYVIEETTMFGSPYYKIYSKEYNNTLKVPASSIEFK